MLVRAAALMLSIVGCAPPATQLVVVVDTDLSVPTELDEVRVTVTRPGGSETEVAMPRTEAELPLTLAVIADGDALGPIQVLAEGRRGGTFVVDRRAEVSLVRGESRVLTLHLVRSCVGVDCGSAALSCTEAGCAAVAVTPPPWPGRPPRLDAGMDAFVPDVPGADAPEPDVPGADVPRLDVPMSDVPRLDAPMSDVPAPRDTPADTSGCRSDGDCDDGIACTLDACSVSGTCTSTPRDAMCDDGNACTDDRCGAGGCTTANNTAACDDGLFCNGADRCAGGSCGHAGSPCSSMTCVEATDSCRTCPPPATGSFAAFTVSVTGSGNTLTFRDNAATPMMGVITVPGVTFSGTFTAMVGITSVFGEGGALRFVGWSGEMGVIAVTGATASGSFTPPCIPFMTSCIPATVNGITGASGAIDLTSNSGASGTITLACP